MLRRLRPAHLALLLLALPPRPARPATPSPAAAPAVPAAPAAPARPSPPATPRDTSAAALLDADPLSLPTPGGKAEDQALWAATLESSFSLVSERGAARQLLWRAQAGRFDELLAARAQGEPSAGAPRAAELRRRLSDAYGKVYGAATRFWGVDPRLGCRSEAIDLEAAMLESRQAETAALRASREQAQRCIDRARAGARALNEANAGLRGVLDEAQAFLSPAPSAGTASPAPAQAR